MPRNVTFTDETAHFGASEQGTTQFKSKDGQATFTLHSRNGKPASISAIGKNGEPLKVFTIRQATPQDDKGSGSGGGPVECWVCIKTPGGEFCYRIDCGDLPPQIPDPKNVL